VTAWLCNNVAVSRFVDYVSGFTVSVLVLMLKVQLNTLFFYIYMYICPCITSISLKYNPQDATFSRSIYFYKFLYVFQAVLPPIIRSTKLYIQCQVLSNHFCCLLLPWMRWNAVPSHPRSSEAQNCTYSVRYCQTITAACC